MSLLPQLLFTGIGIGSIYAMVALGFVLLIRSANVVNFAQGEFSMLGAYFMVILFAGFGVPYPIALIGAVVLMAVF
ncbi:MAG: branched-chain amino acid ABC transporter permease, partial [Rhizobiales bacterium 24-66-13]